MSDTKPSPGRKAIASPEIPEPTFGPRFASPAIEAAGWLFCSGVLPTDYQSAIDAIGYVDPDALYRSEDHDPARLRAQSHSVMRRLQKIFEVAGGDLRTDTIRVEQFSRSPHPTQEDFDTTRDAWAQGVSLTAYFETRNEYIDEARPPSCALGVTDLPIPGADLQVDMIGSVGVEKQRFETPPGVDAPLAGYSPAIKFGDWVSLAGEVPTDWKGDWMSDKHMGRTASTDPRTRPNEYLWYGDQLADQVELTLEKQAKIAEAAGTSIDRCVNATVYIGHPADFSSMDRVWRKWFPDNPPARTVIPYAGLGGKGWRFEVSMDLLTPESKLVPEIITADGVPGAFGHEPHAVKVGNLLFFSTLRAIDSSGVVNTHTPKGFERYVDQGAAQMREILDRIEKISAAAGTSTANLCRIKVFMDDWDVMAPATSELAAAFPVDPPAVSLHRVNGKPVLSPGCRIVADAISYVP